MLTWGGIGWREGEHVWYERDRCGDVWGRFHDGDVFGRNLIWASLLEGACFCQREIPWFVIYLRIKSVRSDFEGRVVRRVWIRVTRRWVEWTFEMADRADKESEIMRNVWDCGKEVERIFSRHWKMAWSLTVRMKAELRWREAKIWSLIEYAKPVRLPILGPSVKHRNAPGKV